MLAATERYFWDSLVRVIAGCVVIGCYACFWSTAPGANVDGAQWFTEPVLVADSQGRVDLRLSESTGSQAHWSLRNVPEEIRLLSSRLEKDAESSRVECDIR